jgi:hypothetical protein
MAHASDYYALNATRCRMNRASRLLKSPQPLGPEAKPQIVASFII